MMSERQIINRVQKLRALESQKAALEKQLAAVKAEIQEDMQDREEIKAGTFIVRWTRTTSYRFDTAAFKREHADLYNQFKKPTETRRFSVAEV